MQKHKHYSGRANEWRTIKKEESIPMVTSEERLKILKMIQEGKITAEEGSQLIGALDSDSATVQPDPAKEVSGSPRGKSGRWFHIRVTDKVEGKTRVNVRIPISLLQVGLKIGAKFSPEVEKIDMDELTQFLNSNETGPIIDVEDGEENEHVEIFVE
jgi:hypothetical protein